MNYSNQYYDSISTVQLSPFGEDQWNRMVTYPPIYVDWSDLVMVTRKRKHKPTSAKRNFINSIDINTIKLGDEILLNELHDIRKSVAKTSLTRLKDKDSYDEARFLDEELGRRTTSPTDEYERSSDFFYRTREPLKPRCSFVESSFSNQQLSARRSLLQPQPSIPKPIKASASFNFGPKPQPSLSVQLQQSAIAREHARAADRRNTSPLTVSSSKRAAGSAHSGRRAYQQNYFSQSQISQLSQINVMGGLYEQFATDSFSSMKQSFTRSTNTSRSTVRMVKTKNDRARQKQHIELKTLLVKPCRQPILGDSDLEESIPNSIEMMRKLGGPITAFERNLRYNYQRQLNQFRNGSTKC